MQSILDRASAAIAGELAFEVNLMKKIESILHNMAVNPSKNGPASEWSRSKKEAGENSEDDVDEVFYEDILGQNILDKHSRRVMRRVNAILAGEAPGEEAVMKMVAKLLKRNTTEGAPLLEREPTEKEVARAKSMAKALAQGPSDATPEGLLKWHDKCIGRTRVPPLKSRDLRNFYREWCNKYGKQSQISEEEDRQESSDDGRSGLPPDVEIMQCVPPESRTPNISESEPEDDAIQETTNLAPR
ncbi:hypothetical protein B0O99DRAFT_619990 [Bisporella sp. PMI_857]|nr:hypothetical protein B0O99DRAFT_619990 [Bisporella sp. PMI_857]